MSKKATKKQIIETHGKVESTSTQPTMLEQVWGYNELSKYGTLDESSYQKQLDDMNRPDLETHARRHGVIIVESTARLREKLVREFRSWVSLLRKPTVSTTAVSNKVAPDEAALRVLAEGR